VINLLTVEKEAKIIMLTTDNTHITTTITATNHKNKKVPRNNQKSL